MSSPRSPSPVRASGAAAVLAAEAHRWSHGVAALDLLGTGRLRVDDLISHRLPLADLEHGLDIVARRAGMKVHLYPAASPIDEETT